MPDSPVKISQPKKIKVIFSFPNDFRKIEEGKIRIEGRDLEEQQLTLASDFLSDLGTVISIFNPFSHGERSGNHKLKLVKIMQDPQREVSHSYELINVDPSNIYYPINEIRAWQDQVKHDLLLDENRDGGRALQPVAFLLIGRVDTTDTDRIVNNLNDLHAELVKYLDLTYGDDRCSKSEDWSKWSDEMLDLASRRDSRLEKLKCRFVGDPNLIDLKVSWEWTAHSHDF